ncbi:uncharacterized protein K02A2.6-like [Penaeus japonicus]|uniref:uncharacterized protein K02A2.6-like n=1 Tax=Penaeus japonicus TaxID=27405 RepID=UPI001C70D01E|nr:uncharacterized protein K02A2.6-like [Penaeus japonicus]
MPLGGSSSDSEVAIQVTTVGCRIQTWLKNNWNRDNFIFLPKDHLLSRLIVTELHNVNHEGIETTLAKLLSKFWLPGARRLIKSVKGKCVKCRRFDKNLQEQCMGQVIEGRLKPSAPFYHTATDLFGPFAIRDSVKRRTHGKCFGVIFTCLSSRAVHLDIVENYSTEAFIGAIQRFVSIRGYPYSIHSDNGTQMVAANKELIKISRELDKRHIVRSMSNKGVEWSFNRSSDAPWLNGSCESLIKSVKMSIQKAIGESILTYAEFHTVLFEIANLINSRPIGMKPGYTIELGSYLCPNDLLLGRSNREAPFGKFDLGSTLNKRLHFTQNIVFSFWKRWQRDYFPMLIVRKSGTTFEYSDEDINVDTRL